MAPVRRGLHEKCRSPSPQPARSSPEAPAGPPPPKVGRVRGGRVVRGKGQIRSAAGGRVGWRPFAEGFTRSAAAQVRSPREARLRPPQDRPHPKWGESEEAEWCAGKDLCGAPQQRGSDGARSPRASREVQEPKSAARAKLA